MPDDSPDDRPQDRRRFFAAGFAKLIRPLADAIEKRLPIQLPILRERLRPPGARPEKQFLDTCFRCGACADACPAKCIILFQTTDENLRGTPVIDPDLSACVVCDELACMKACPSGALALKDRFDIRMGLAAVRHDLCVRSKGEECRICVDRCPLGDTAILLATDGKVHVIDPETNSGRGCIGCGICQFYCPTMPKSIVVSPN